MNRYIFEGDYIPAFSVFADCEQSAYLRAYWAIGCAQADKLLWLVSWAPV